MANIIRLAKWGNDWGFNELDAYNISVAEQEQETFFEGPLPAYTGPAGFLQHENRVQGLDASSLALIKRLDLAMKIMEGEESAVDDFAAELLRSMGYETEETVIRTRKNIRLNMCGEQVHAKTDVCVLDAAFEILLLVQEDKTHINPRDPEPQFIAEAIAAFQSNNAKRVDDLFLDPLQTMVIPGITMTQTFPKFYKIKVTADLDHCVRRGQFPAVQTIVYRHTPRVPRRRSDGMRPLDNRELMLRCYEAFR
ncbi:hypothetical protein OG21DRAFT_1394243, partial [Imleria badia]